MYDLYVSLGMNCEAAFQFRRVIGKDISSYFNWMVTPFDSLIAIIEADFEGVFARDNIAPAANRRMTLDRRFGVQFHTAFHDEVGADYAGPVFDELYDAYRRKLAHLRAKWLDTAASNRKTLYVVKTDVEHARAKALALRDLIARKYQGHDCDLLILQAAAKAEAPWAETRIFNRYLRRFAPIDDAPDAHLESWNRIFAEFPLHTAQIQTAANADAADAAAHYEAGLALARDGHCAEAEAAFRRALAIDLNLPLAHHHLGIALAQQQRHAEAEAAQRRAIKLSPNNAGFHYRLGQALTAQERYEEAIAAHHQAITINASNPALFEALAAALSHLGWRDEAGSVAQRARALRTPAAAPPAGTARAA